jgi:ammonium transporter, Amt family
LAATSLKHAFGYDDSLDAFGVHGVGGILGALLTGVFFSSEISGVDKTVAAQLWIQAKGVLTTLVYGFAVSYVILLVLDKTVGLRVTEEQEREGLDISLHGESIE